MILNVTDDVKWIGIPDPELRSFDIVMETKYGTTYNSYFINAQEKAVIDTAKVKFLDEYLDKIKKVTNPSEIKYIIVNHTEPDHSGSISSLLALAPEATVAGSGNAIRYLRDILNTDFNCWVVKDGDKIDLGNKSLKIIGAPNLHWPDSIYSYLEEDRVLFSCDSFGCHYCDNKVFDDLVGDFDDAFKYYFDVILKPYSRFMLRAIEKIRLLDISIIAPGHGPVLRSNWKKYVDLSEKYAKEALALPEDKLIFIPFVSAYNYTALLAEKIALGALMVPGIKVEMLDIQNSQPQVLDIFLSRCSGLIVGSPTINQNTLPQIYQIFSLINPLRDRSKLAAVFGSFGWSGESADIIEASLKLLKFNIFPQRFNVKFKPSEDDLNNAISFGKAFAEKLLLNKIV